MAHPIRRPLEKLPPLYTHENTPPDRVPTVKVFNPTGGQTWYLSEIGEDGTLFGLCDLGMGFPELGYVHISDLEAIRGKVIPIPVEVDKFWTGTLADAQKAAGI